MREDDLRAELVKVNDAIDAILAGGQSYSIGSGGGTRATTSASLDTLYKRKRDIEYSLYCLSGQSGLRVGFGW